MLCLYILIELINSNIRIATHEPLKRPVPVYALFLQSEENYDIKEAIDW